MEINLSDMIVFKNNYDNSIHRDCVEEIKHSDKMTSVFCNSFRVDLTDKVEFILAKYGGSYSLVEIWRMKDEDTYKRIWKDDRE